MTYRGKTIIKHNRGNWFGRVLHNGKIINIYGRTQVEAYDKLKMFVDKIEADKLLLNQAKLLAKLNALPLQVIPMPTMQNQLQTPVVAKSTTKDYTLKEWFDEWLNSYKVGNVRPTTIKGFTETIRYLKKLYETKICELTNLMLAKAINEISAYRMRDKVHNLSKQMFSVAFNNRLIETNPAANLPRPKQMPVNQQKAFMAEQEKRFIDLCLTDLDKYEPFLVCVLQGLRKGEMLALRPNDFDFVNNTLRIDESYDYEFPDDLQTKNATSNRTMPMFAMTKQVLLKYADHPQKERIYANIGHPIFLPVKLKKLCKQNNLPELTLHQLRHTFISRCHEKGVDELIVQGWVGHAKGSRMTKAVYTHVSNDIERKFIDILNGTNIVDMAKND